MAWLQTAVETLGQLVGLELGDRAPGIRCQRVFLAVDLRRLKLDVGRSLDRSRAVRPRAVVHAQEVELDLPRPFPTGSRHSKIGSSSFARRWLFAFMARCRPS